ncbi:hypothetical protein Bbelb_371360 [Branchiostoma belcheri]|nr:hypothetical protein Bbelb_371360 [Branchiostoma belcheri]
MDVDKCKDRTSEISGASVTHIYICTRTGRQLNAAKPSSALNWEMDFASATLGSSSFRSLMVRGKNESLSMRSSRSNMMTPCVASGGVVVDHLTVNRETQVRIRGVPGTCLNMRPDVVPLGKALNTTFLTPPRCEWVPNFGWGKSY